jgi:hypothetical protein
MMARSEAQTTNREVVGDRLNDAINAVRGLKSVLKGMSDSIYAQCDSIADSYEAAVVCANAIGDALIDAHEAYWLDSKDVPARPQR